jgi:hypothetical protein
MLCYSVDVLRVGLGLISMGFAGVLVGCAGESRAVDERIELPRVDEPLPERLSDFHLYPEAPDLGVVAQGALAYEPEWPLWSNGGEKQRFIAVPADAQGSAFEELPDPEQLPLGTAFFKTFSFVLDENGSAPSPVETRVMRLGDEGWEFARYQWNETRTDASLVTTPRSISVAVNVAGERFDHKIPTELDCKTCHEAAPTRVLGYTKLQVFERSIVEASNPETEAVLGYIVGNCVNCHNGSDEEGAAYDLRPAVFFANTIDHPTESSASGAGIRIVPGKPEESALLTALRGGDMDAGFKPMPPLGVQRIDAEGVELLRSWIQDLPSWYDASHEP